MALEFEASCPAFFPTMAREEAPPRSGRSAQRQRLALISTTNELCGIAAYARSLERQLGDLFEVGLFDLNQYLLRSTHPRVRRFGDRHIRDICRRLADYDAVNLQLEHGTLGHLAGDIYRRFAWIVKASARISVTFHTIFSPEPRDSVAWAGKLLRRNFAQAMALRAHSRRQWLLSAGMARRLRGAQRVKPVSVIVHTRRDHAHMRYVNGIREVYDHPLSFLDRAECREIRRTASRRRFAILDPLPADSKLVGVFGFLGRYKGFDTVARALHHLPDDYHLLIFGGVHPNEIKQQQAIDPVLSSLFEAGYIDTSLAERLRAASGGGAPAVSFTIEGSMRELLIGHPKDLSRRIHFLGATSDAEFLEGMAICDAVVFPYLEVGQSSSGPISQSLELGCRVIASRTHAFLQFGRYHPNRIEYFDIGNHLELAARLLARRQFTETPEPAFNTETNKAIYLAANAGTGGADSGRRRLRLPSMARMRAHSGAGEIAG